MNFLKKWWRLVYISYIFNRYNLAPVLASIPVLRLLRFTVYMNPFFWIRTRRLSPEQRLRLALEHLGPIFIKFGQALSTRRDLLPSHLADELAALQDRVPPFAADKAKTIIENALNTRIDECFATFSTTPLASASIAQVHQATFHDGTEVIIKVLRPNIHKILKRDTDLLRTLAQLIERYFPKTRRLRPIAVVDEITRSLLDELDLMREAANASQLRRNFDGDSTLYIPAVYWDYCRTQVMTMEKVNGMPVGQVDALKAQGVDMKRLAERGVIIFYTQVFRDCFFHADMHPGNIFIDATDPSDPTYIAIDFGIVGTLSQEDQQYLAGNFLAFFNRDYKKVAQLHIESGWVPANTRVDELEAAIRTVCEPIFEKPLKDISFGYTLMRLFQVARRFEMTVQPQLVMLQKTLLNIEGLGRQLDPSLNLWQTAKPFLEKWMKQRLGMRGFMKRSYDSMPRISEKLPELPDLVFDILQKTQNSYRQQQVDQQTATTEQKSKQPYRNPLFLIAGLLIGIGGLSHFDQGPFVIWSVDFLKNNPWLSISTGAILILWYFKRR